MSSLDKPSPPESPLVKAQSSSSFSKSVEDDPCTDRCRSKEHGKRIWEIAQAGNDTEVVALWTKSCLNYAQVKDDYGRTALHSAASFGKFRAVEWVLKSQQTNPNLKDFISGYTPLHRSIYYGHLHVAASLIKNGVDLNVRDNEGLTALELCQLDRPIPFQQNSGDLTELTVWGSNNNFNLGLGHQEPRGMPDVVEKFRKNSDLSLVKIDMNTYHTVFLTQTGKVYTCGYGMGGRLGTGEETTVLVPVMLQLRSAGPCVSIAAGEDHTIFLTDTKVWTVGSNQFGQLGQPQKLQRLLAPRSVDSLQKYKITEVLASSVHSTFYNKNLVLMVGLNQGQFGKTVAGQEVNTPVNVYTPTVVSDRLALDTVGKGVAGPSQQVTTVGGNEYCTGICIDNRYLFLLRRYQSIRIDSKNTTSQEIVKIQAGGDKSNIVLFILTSSGRVLIWRENYNRQTNESKGAYTRLVFSHNRLLDVKDFSVNSSALVVITSTGDAFKAGWNVANPPTIIGTIDERYGQVADTGFQISVQVRRGRRNNAGAPMALEQMKVKRVPNVHTGLQVCSDGKGNNYAILQRHQMMDVTDIPYVGESTMIEDLRDLYEMTADDDNVHDVVFDVGCEHYPAHRLILMSASPLIGKVLSSTVSSSTEPVRIKVTNHLFGVDPSKFPTLEDCKNFKVILDLMYTRRCFFTSDKFIEDIRACAVFDGKRRGSYFGEKIKEIMRFRNLCRYLGFEAGFSVLQELVGVLDVLPDSPDAVVSPPKSPTMTFDRVAAKGFSDVVLESSDNVLLPAHRCVLVARLEYFRSLFSTNWSQGFLNLKKNGTLKVPFSAKALSALLTYVYTDDRNVIHDAEYDLVWETIASSDYMMVDRLLQISESEMTKHISLKNVTDIMVFAFKHNGFQLRDTCFDFISLNLPAMLENRNLDNVPSDMLDALGKYYRDSQRRNLNLDRNLPESYSCPPRENYENALNQTAPDILELIEDVEDMEKAILMKTMSSKSSKSKARSSRSKTLSESESCQDTNVTAGGDGKITPDLMLRIDCAIEARKYGTPPGSPVAGASVYDTKPKRTIVPLPRNTHPLTGTGTSLKQVQSCPLRIEEFPSLGDTSTTATSPLRAVVSSYSLDKTPQRNSEPKHTTPRSANKKPATSASSPKSTNLSPSAKSENSLSSPKPTTSTSSRTPWQLPLSPGDRKSTPAVFAQSNTVNTPSSPVLSLESPKPQQKPGSGKRKTKWRAIKSETDIKSPEPIAEEASGSSSPSGAAMTSDGRDRNNPWKVKQSAEVTFKDIIDDEVEKKRNFEKATSKSLTMMQIEDEAINCLTHRYTSEDTIDFIEILNVERVVTSNYSTPMWVQHPGALTSPKPYDTLTSKSFPSFKTDVKS